MNKLVRNHAIPALALSMLAAPSAFGATYGATAIVATSGGDYTDPAAAMADVATWCGTPSDTSRCQIRIMPGNYTLTANLGMQEWVDVAGSGRHSTVLEGSGSNFYLVTVAENSELRSLTVRAGGWDLPGNRLGVNFASESVNSAIRDVRVEMFGRAMGQARGISYHKGSPTIENSDVAMEVRTWSTGIIGSYGDPQINNVTVAMTGESTNIGIEFTSGSPHLRNSKITAGGAPGNEGIRMRQSKAVIEDTDIRVDGGSTGTGVALFNTSGGGANSQMLRVRAIGKGTVGYGVLNNAPSSTSRLDHSWVVGSTAGIKTDNGHTSLVTFTKITGGVTTAGGTTTCAATVDNATTTFYPNTCP